MQSERLSLQAAPRSVDSAELTQEIIFSLSVAELSAARDYLQVDPRLLPTNFPLNFK
jgi:hypothetical protein